MALEARWRRGMRAFKRKLWGARDEIAKMHLDMAKGGFLALVAALFLKGEPEWLSITMVVLFALMNWAMGIVIYSGKEER